MDALSLKAYMRLQAAMGINNPASQWRKKESDLCVKAQPCYLIIFVYCVSVGIFCDVNSLLFNDCISLFVL